MKILFISEYFPTSDNLDIHGGIELRAYYIAKYLAKKHQIYVITSYLGNHIRRRSFSGIKILYIGPKRTYSRLGEIRNRILFMLLAIWNGLWIDFDLVEGSSFFGWFPAWILGLIKAKIKTIIVADTTTDFVSGINLIGLKSIELMEKFLIFRKWHSIICISDVVKKKLIKLGINKEKIHKIYCGVDLELINQIEKKHSQTLTICCVSRLVPYKRIIDLLEAIKLLKKELPTIKCSIVGSGEDEIRIKKFIKHWKLYRFVKLYGFLKKYSDVIKIIKRSYIFCLSSIVEGFGIVTIESLACKVPVVLTDMPINREITKGKGVLFFKPKNIFDLADKIKLIWNNKKLYKKLQEEGYLIAQKYSWELSAQKFKKLYENLYLN